MKLSLPGCGLDQVSIQLHLQEKNGDKISLQNLPISILGRVHMFQIASRGCSIVVLAGLLGRQRLRTVRGSEQREAGPDSFLVIRIRHCNENVNV